MLLKKWNSQRVRSHSYPSTIGTCKHGTSCNFLQMTAENLERSKVSAGTGPPPFTPFKTSVAASGSKTGADKMTTAEARASHVKKPSSSGYLTKSTELSKKQQPYYYESSKPSSRDSRRPQESGKTEDKGRGKGEEKMKSEPTGKTNLKQRESRREGGGIDSKRSSKGSQNQAISGLSKEKDGEREVKYQMKSSGKRADSKDGSGFGDGNSRDFVEPQKGGYSHRDRGRRGRGRGTTDLDNHRTSSLGEFDSEPHRTKKPHHEGGRRGRGRGRGRGKGRRGRRYDDDDDGDYQPSSRPTTGLSLGDYFDQKLVLSDRHDSSHFGWYEEDYMYDPSYKWEQPYNGMEEYRASYADQREARRTRTDKTRAKEAWAEEEYPPMPSAKVPSASGPRPSPPPPPPQEQPTGESHWDWVSGSGAPSTATKKK